MRKKGDDIIMFFFFNFYSSNKCVVTPRSLIKITRPLFFSGLIAVLHVILLMFSFSLKTTKM